MKKLLTLAEFALCIGRSERQVRRYVSLGRLVAIETDQGLRLTVDDLEAWGPIRKPGFPTSDTDAGHNDGSKPDVLSDVKATDGQGVGRTQEHVISAVPVEVHLKTLDLSANLLEQLRASQAATDREREEKERAREERDRATRRADQLAQEMHSYMRALGEQAESLAEERARRMALELAVGKVEGKLDTETVEVGDIAEGPTGISQPISEITLDRLPAAAGYAPRAGGWGRRLKLWFLGEKTGS